MVSAPTTMDSLKDGALRAATYARTAAMAAAALAIHGRHLIVRPPERDPRDAIGCARARLRALLDANHADACDGIYPRDILFDLPLASYVRALPTLLRDHRDIISRRDAGAWRDLPDGVDLSTYPAYYRRTFHWQTDGYLSARSAELYEVGVEVLFLGAADAMRRRVIRPLVEASRGERHPIVLDVACGTGRTLGFLAAALPEARLTGVDLSPWYVQYARRRLGHVTDLSLLVAQGEDLPLRDGYAHHVTSTFLFHELPRKVRRAVLAELFRTVRPGGTLVILDAAQLSDAPQLEVPLQTFPRDFHEPFFDDYIRDPLEEAVAEVGFTDVEVSPAYLSKLVVARRPD